MRELREGDQIVSMTPKAGAGPAELERGRELLRSIEHAQRDRKPAVGGRAKNIGALLLWIAAIAAAIVLGVRVCA
jgi:hypothetical protein